MASIEEDGTIKELNIINTEEGLFQFTIGLTMIGLGHVDSNGSVQSAIGLG